MFLTGTACGFPYRQRTFPGSTMHDFWKFLGSANRPEGAGHPLDTFYLFRVPFMAHLKAMVDLIISAMFDDQSINKRRPLSHRLLIIISIIGRHKKDIISLLFVRVSSPGHPLSCCGGRYALLSWNTEQRQKQQVRYCLLYAAAEEKCLSSRYIGSVVPWSKVKVRYAVRRRRRRCVSIDLKAPTLLRKRGRKSFVCVHRSGIDSWRAPLTWMREHALSTQLNKTYTHDVASAGQVFFCTVYRANAEYLPAHTKGRGTVYHLINTSSEAKGNCGQLWTIWVEVAIEGSIKRLGLFSEREERQNSNHLTVGPEMFNFSGRQYEPG